MRPLCFVLRRRETPILSSTRSAQSQVLDSKCGRDKESEIKGYESSEKKDMQRWFGGAKWTCYLPIWRDSSLFETGQRRSPAIKVEGC